MPQTLLYSASSITEATSQPAPTDYTTTVGPEKANSSIGGRGVTARDCRLDIAEKIIRLSANGFNEIPKRKSFEERIYEEDAAIWQLRQGKVLAVQVFHSERATPCGQVGGES